MSSGDLLTRKYNSFRGIDFTNYEVNMYRSPDAKNMWKNYKSLGKGIESRPDIETFLELTNTIYGLFFYTIARIEHMIIHSGVSLYDYNMQTKEIKLIKETGMNPRRSQSFIYQNLFYIKDGINYLVYDGEILSEVKGYIPITTISRSPSGGGTVFEGVNMLSKYRKNSFCADGKSTIYYCDSETFTSSNVRVWINDIELTSGFEADVSSGSVTFEIAPEAPLTDGQDNVIIQFEKEVTGYSNRINKCTLLAVFDDRVFFAGNQDYPNVLWHCSINDPTYIADTDYYNEGLDLSPIKALVPGNNALWVFKETLLELAYQTAYSLTLASVEHIVVIVIEFCLRIGLMGILEGEGNKLLTQDLVELALTVRAILHDGFIHDIPSLDAPLVTPDNSTDVGLHTLAQ